MMGRLTSSFTQVHATALLRRRCWALLPLALLLVLVAGCRSGGPSAADPVFTDTPAPSSTAMPSPTPQPTPEPTPTPSPSPTPAPLSLLIVNATVIDGTGAEPLYNGYVAVRDGLIESVGPVSELGERPAERVIDAAGATLMPGLIDGHVHVARLLENHPTESQVAGYQSRFLPFLHQGFTTLRDVGVATNVFPFARPLAEQWRDEGRAPHIVWAGPMITTPGGYPISRPRYASIGHEVGSADEGAALVDRLADEGATIIKLGLDRGYYGDDGWPLMPLETVQAITARAHERGLIVTAHVTSIEEVRLAMDGGVDNLAHAPLQHIPDEMFLEMIERGFGMVTTATVWGQRNSVAASNAARYAAAGGIVNIGTDYGCCGQAPGVEPYLYEMYYLWQHGMTPMQLLVAATRNGAILANVADRKGTIEPGKDADMIILRGDPLADIFALRNIGAVVLGGAVVYER
jgi:imidazolonepropionase-like amidohydrolase